ncbi:MAG: CxxC-x17-CxxC domain-containing protein [Methanosarcina sp.]
MAYNDRGNPFRGRDSNRGSRDNSRGGYQGGNSGPREMHKTKCSDCGVETEVPFKPDPDRPVYCRECLPKHRKPREDRY